MHQEQTQPFPCHLSCICTLFSFIKIKFEMLIFSKLTLQVTFSLVSLIFKLSNNIR